MSWFSNIAERWFRPALPVTRQTIEDLATYSAPSAAHSADWRYRNHDGESYPGGFGPTEILLPDYWTLRARSASLFKTNLYARTVVRRLITNIINTGLHLEATPEESILGVPTGSLQDWTEEVENLFHIWAKEPRLCDVTEGQSFGALQAIAELEALVSGDVLCVLIQDRQTHLPRVKLVDGSSVQSPSGAPPKAMGKKNRIVHGVELDPSGRQVAYWVRKETPGSGQFEFTRLAAVGRGGRTQAWLLYGTDKRLDDVRGEPLLSLVLQQFKEIDRYRDAILRKAVLASNIAIFVSKTEDKPGTHPLTGGAQRRGTETTTPQDATASRTYEVQEHMPGIVIQELQVGEKPEAFQSHIADEKFGDFEEAILASCAALFGIPPEIFRLSFSSNYSASQAANNEFKILLNELRTRFGAEFCRPIYNEWLLSQALLQRIEAPGLIEAWRDPSKYEILGAWRDADWSGHIKPSIDMVKAARANEEMAMSGFITRARAARELTGTKLSKNLEKLKAENIDLAAANAPLEPEPAVVAPPPPPARDNDDDGDDSDNKKPASRASHLELAADGVHELDRLDAAAS